MNFQTIELFSDMVFSQVHIVSDYTYSDGIYSRLSVLSC